MLEVPPAVYGAAQADLSDLRLAAAVVRGKRVAPGVTAWVVPGSEIKVHIENLFGNPKIAYLHLHNAGAGCYSCRAEPV